MSPKTWMRKVYFQRYIKLDILARLGVGLYVIAIESVADKKYFKILDLFSSERRH